MTPFIQVATASPTNHLQYIATKHLSSVDILHPCSCIYVWSTAPHKFSQAWAECLPHYSHRASTPSGLAHSQSQCRMSGTTASSKSSCWALQASTSSLLAKRPLIRGLTSAYALREAYLMVFSNFLFLRFSRYLHPYIHNISNLHLIQVQGSMTGRTHLATRCSRVKSSPV